MEGLVELREVPLQQAILERKRRTVKMDSVNTVFRLYDVLSEHPVVNLSCE